MRTTNIRFTGLASGLDTESIIQGMTIGQKNKVDVSKQNKLLMDMQKAKYKEVSTKVKDFTTKWVGNMRLTSAFNKITTTVSDKDKVTVTGSITSGSHVIDEVTALAKSAKLSTTSTGLDGKSTLKDLGITFTDGEDIILKLSDKKDANGDKVVRELKITENTTLEDLGTQMNTLMPNTNVTYDSLAKGFFISSKGTGESQFIDIEVVNRPSDAKDNLSDRENDEVLGKLKIGSGNRVEEKGGNLLMKYNGMPIESESNSVSINGLSFTINSKIDKNSPVEINAQQNTDEIYKYVKEFIEEYNKLVRELNGLVDAKPNKDYKPLLDEQKKEMSEYEIEEWNKKINDSLLSGNTTVRGITQDLRNIMGSVVDGLGIGSLYEIGISTGEWKDKGVLIINEDKLKKAINNNTDDVIALFAGKDSVEGIADRLYTSLNDRFKSISGTKSSISVFNDIALDDRIKDAEKKTLKLEEQLIRMEDMYYKKFAAMEQMMQQLNSQSSWLATQTGGM